MEETQQSQTEKIEAKSESGSVRSRLIVFVLLAIAIFSSIYAAQKINSQHEADEKIPTISTITPTPATEVIEDAQKCIITLMGKKYDVTDFREIHKGGNLFVCGTDMTEKYIGKHGKDEKRPSLLLIDDKGNFVNKK